MREFLLVLPDLMLASELPPTALATAVPTLRFGAAGPLAGGWRSWLARRLGQPDLEGLPLAAAVAASLPQSETMGGRRAAQGCWLATPLHLVAGLDTLHLPRDGILTLAPQERAELVAGFATALGGEGLTLQAVEGDALLLSGLVRPEVTTCEPAVCLGADLVCAQPAGPGAAALRRLMAEIEMWLHEHPLNRRREREGRRAVRSLWLWGGDAREATAPRCGATLAVEAGNEVEAASAGADVRRVHSDDAWVRAAARLAAVELAPEGELPGPRDFGAPGDVIATASLRGADLTDLAEFEQRHLGPAIDALASGRLERISVLAADRRVTVAAADRYRLWRPRRPWLTALGEGR